MSENGNRNILCGVAAGVAGGLVASWIMNLFMEKAGSAITEAVESEEEKQRALQQQDGAKEDATMKAADAVVNTVTGGRHLSHSEKETGGPIVHYAFGAIMGGLYGGLAECFDAARAGQGTAFGSALFIGADMIAVPALGLADSSASPSALASPLAAHLVYGFTTEMVRRAVRAGLAKAA